MWAWAGRPVGKAVGLSVPGADLSNDSDGTLQQIDYDAKLPRGFFAANPPS